MNLNFYWGHQLEFSDLKTQLILRYQKDFPLCSRPYLKIAEEIGSTEELVRSTFEEMLYEGMITRVGPVFATGRVGKSFLAAVKCPLDRINEVAEVINSYPEVNHNYLRENELNIWFVMTAIDEARLQEKALEIESKIKLPIHQFKMIRPYKIDLSLKEAKNE